MNVRRLALVTLLWEWERGFVLVGWPKLFLKIACHFLFFIREHCPKEKDRRKSRIARANLNYTAKKSSGSRGLRGKSAGGFGAL